MYVLMSIDAVARIAVAMAIMFVIVPLLAWPRRQSVSILEWFFWNLGVGIALLTLIGQILSIARLFSLPTLLLLAAVIIVIGRAASQKVAPWILVRQASEKAFLVVLNIFDGRINLRRRAMRRIRRGRAALRNIPSRRMSLILAWCALAAIAGAFRFYRPLLSANLGFSDTYVHLYLLKLLEEGQQVDPAWGPYPRGMHFLLLAIDRLTNSDDILLMNFFGPFVGVLMTLGVAACARRLAQSELAGLCTGFLFATLVGGAGQYFLLGGAFDRDGPFLSNLSYAELLNRAGEFDTAFVDFQRQTSTLSQELAIALLFPAAMFLLDYLRKRERWHLLGYLGCTAAIAAVHSGVLAPLILMSALAAGAVALDRKLTRVTFQRAALGGAMAIIIGSSWILAFIAYPYAGGKSPTSSDSSVGSTALHYFPLLRGFAGQDADKAAQQTLPFVPLTPFLVVCMALAIALIVAAFLRRDERQGNVVWIAAVFLLFLLNHFATALGLPQLIDMRRNSQWLLMSMTMLIGVGVGEVESSLSSRSSKRPLAIASGAFLLLLMAWISRVPRLTEPMIHNRLVNYSGYGSTALAVLRVERSLEPYTWTIVSYGQEFPMVLRRGFHLPAADFLEQYDPGAEVVPIPTRHIFIIVEKTPHPFQINTWKLRFTRSDLQQRLQTWVQLYQAAHNDMRVYLDDETVRVYEIRRTAGDMEKLSRGAKQ